MNTFIFLALAAALIFFFAKKARRSGADGKKREAPLWLKQMAQRAQTTPHSQYKRKPQLLNRYELELHSRLAEAFPKMLIFSQVSMSQVFHIDGDNSERYRKLGEIGRKSLDFLVCQRSDSKILVAIELNGPSHLRGEQRQSDDKKAEALRQAGIPLIVFYPECMPSAAEIQRIVISHIPKRGGYNEY